MRWPHLLPVTTCKPPTLFKSVFEDPEKEYEKNQVAILKCPQGKKFKESSKTHIAKCRDNGVWDISLWNFITKDCISKYRKQLDIYVFATCSSLLPIPRQRM